MSSSERDLRQIEKLGYLKNQLNNFNVPYYATGETIKQFPSDFNQFPYPRFFRGIVKSDYPVILDREPGYSKVYSTKSYDYKEGLNDKAANYFFQIPCSTVLPPQNEKTWSNREFHMNNNCIYNGQE